MHIRGTNELRAAGGLTAATTGTVSLAELGESSPPGDVVVWDWRAGIATRTGPDHS